MPNFRPTDRLTSFLMPPSIDQWLPQRHLARFVVEVVDALDLSAMSKSYRGSGSASYHPAVLLSLLLYGCATGVFSSRKLERATYDSVAFRFIAANDHPDHDTIATFRRRFLKEIEALFVKVLLLAREIGVLTMGTVALDGTKIHANASRHSALSYEHAGKIEAQLTAEVAELLAKAEAADQADVPDGLSIPEELERRKVRVEKLAAARATIEARAKQRFDREQAEHQAKVEAREAKIEATGKKPAGKPPQPPVEGPLPTDQVNLTDEESRIMPVAGGGFEQCYNAQAVVAEGSLLVVAVDVVQAANDKQQLEPMLNQVVALPEVLGNAETLLADNGYFSAANEIMLNCRDRLQRLDRIMVIVGLLHFGSHHMDRDHRMGQDHAEPRFRGPAHAGGYLGECDQARGPRLKQGGRLGKSLHHWIVGRARLDGGSPAG